MTSREKIIDAAITVFAAKGRYGAHMEEIAAQASINKAMIYYIFHSKDDLYLEVLKTIFVDLFQKVVDAQNSDIASGVESPQLLSNHVSRMFDVFTKNPNFTKITVDAISNGAQELPVVLKYCKSLFGAETFRDFTKLFMRGVDDGSFRNLDTDQLNLSIQGMVMILFFTGSLSEVLDIQIDDSEQFLERRKASIIDLILHGVLSPGGNSAMVNA